MCHNNSRRGSYILKMSSPGLYFKEGLNCIEVMSYMRDLEPLRTEPLVQMVRVGRLVVDLATQPNDQHRLLKVEETLVFFTPFTKRIQKNNWNV